LKDKTRPLTTLTNPESPSKIPITTCYIKNAVDTQGHFSDTISESVAARLTNEGIAAFAGIDAGLAGIQATVDGGAAWSRALSPPWLADFGRMSAGPLKVQNESESKGFLARCCAPVPPSQTVHSATQAEAAA